MNPVSEFVDGTAGATTIAATISGQYSLQVGQSIRIVPRSTSRTSRLKWSSTNSSVAAVNAQGTVTAIANGSATVTVSGSGVLESYAVAVVSPAATLTNFSLQPGPTVSVTTGQAQQFSTTQSWSDGAVRTSGVTYSATGGTISSSGLFTAGNLAGAFMVIASCSCSTPAIADTTFVTVNAVAQLTKLTISPKTVSLAPGSGQQFSVTANWSTGATTVPPVSWSSTGGTVSSTGGYMAPTTAGTYRVIVAHSGGTVRDTAVVTVTGGATPPPPTPTNNSFGAGPNAPAWSNKTVYQEELFNTPIPVHYAAENAAGFKGWQGFDGAWGITHNPTRVTYPTVNTPLGMKPVLQVTFPGSSGNLSGVGQATAPWPTNQAWSVRVTGTWSGTLVFERSTDGVTWSEVVLTGSRGMSGSIPPSGSRTTIGGVWISGDALTAKGGRFRVRAVSWGSGTASVEVGMQGGAAAARMSAGNFTGKPTKIYTRLLMHADENWTNGGNGGTKFFFFSQNDGNNHFTGVIGGADNEGTSGAFVGLQGTSFRNIPGTLRVSNTEWLDIEFLFISNVPGVHNGIAKAWINGKEALNAADVMFFAAGKTPGFLNIFLDPTYGGGSAPPPRNVSFQIAAWYRESAP